MKLLYDDLNGPFMAGDFEYAPPSYMMGIKLNTVNSVTGWGMGAGGRPVWEEKSTRIPCAATVGSK